MKHHHDKSTTLCQIYPTIEIDIKRSWSCVSHNFAPNLKHICTLNIWNFSPFVKLQNKNSETNYKEVKYVQS